MTGLEFNSPTGPRKLVTCMLTGSVKMPPKGGRGLGKRAWRLGLRVSYLINLKFVINVKNWRPRRRTSLNCYYMAEVQVPVPVECGSES